LEDYLEHTRTAVDRLASGYDEQELKNGIIKWMRGVVQKIYVKYFPPGSELLELNAGTGTDALYLAKNGYKVFATDISQAMIEILCGKAGREGLAGMIRAEPYSFDEIDKIKKNDFDGVISNFGGLNCINDFDKLSSDLADKIKEGGRFIAAVMNRVCPWEILSYLIKLYPKEAFRRLQKEGIEADFNKEKVRTFYFSPVRFGKFFNRYFITERIYTLGLFTPAPYMYGLYNRFPYLVKPLMKTDEIIKGIFPFNRFGDHFIIVMKRK
jgi:SAM-dependent methyltransferase